ncbi:MAG: peptidylprolyl isomerase [Candidatus Thermoplasmatota archaeon]|nr:peptidylprolyl isomerase [Candidatus Thermoplasmatota archaeon]
MTAVQIGDTVQVEYEGRLEDGTVFDSSKNHDQPLEFCVGSGQIIKGFDDAVLGMMQGEEKEVTIAPDEAYGEYKEDLVREIPRNVFPEDQEVKAGMVFIMNLEGGQQIPVRITNVEEDLVTVDLNPPLAGKTLIFKIKLLAIIPKSA